MRAGIIRIQDLRVPTIVGIKEDERVNPQEVTINVQMETDMEECIRTDDITDAFNYRTLTKKIIREVGEAKHFLLEKLCQHVLNIVMEDARIIEASVEIDKPGALRFAKSVSVRLSAKR